MKTLTLAALAMSLCAASPAYAEKPTDPQTELIVNLAVITASVDRCHFEIDSRIIGLDLLKELMLLEDAPPGARYHYNMASALTTAATAVQGAYDEDPREWCESTWRNYGPDGVTKKGWITRRGAPIAAQILSRPQIKRAIVMRAQDSCSANEAVGKRPSPMRAIRHAAS